MNIKNTYDSRVAQLMVLICCMMMLLNSCGGDFSSRNDQVKIAFWGDSRENKDNAAEHIADVLLNKITDWDFQVHAGDFTSHGSEEDWQRSLAYKGTDSLFVPGKFLMCTSNHDDKLVTYDKYTAGVLPVNNVNSATHFFAYHFKNVHLLFCDAYFSDSSSMASWLDKELANIPEDDWIIGVWHAPCYGDITYKKSYLDKCGPWLDKIAARGGDFILHGHAHTYVRSHPLLPDGEIDHNNGMVHLVNGCGGASWRDPQEVVAKTAFTPAVKAFPVITFITLENETATIQTVDARPDSNLAVIDKWVWKQDLGARR
ncbi:metallophosphoesterase family protein [Candidatus Neomarinimicrobiota bacterium]